MKRDTSGQFKAAEPAAAPSKRKAKRRPKPATAIEILGMALLGAALQPVARDSVDLDTKIGGVPIGIDTVAGAGAAIFVGTRKGQASREAPAQLVAALGGGLMSRTVADAADAVLESFKEKPEEKKPEEKKP